jgi:queuine tRNA-ribosyltransferase
VGDPNPFKLEATDGNARAGVLKLPSGTVHTPVFMPVGTQATVKSLDPHDLRQLGARIILANTYHLMLRPGAALIEQLGGVARFMCWDGPILTDSGGFQVFSLAERRKLSESGVEFRSHIDGSVHQLTPETAIRLQQQLGADISMVLDVCTGFQAGADEQAAAMELTHRWLPRNIAAFEELVDINEEIRPLLFGIAQGGFDRERRVDSARFVANSRVDGWAIGGLSVGEPKAVLQEMLGASLSGLGCKRPRYLMGVGSPEDLWIAVGEGVDMFDCVLPTRVARHGALFTPDGRVNLRASRFRSLDQPVDGSCDCYACRTFSAAYIHHLFRAGELLAYRLATIHNLRFITRQMESMRSSIVDGSFDGAKQEFLERYMPADQSTRVEQRAFFRARVRK